jgi:hypothetical protein
MNGLFAPRAKKQRRPAGVSRRHKKQFSFEALEPRQVMSAASIVAPPQLSFGPTATDTASVDMSALYNSLTAQQRAALDAEASWYAQNSSTGSHSTVEVNSAPNDPLFQHPWHLLNTGQNTGAGRRHQRDGGLEPRLYRRGGDGRCFR